KVVTRFPPEPSGYLHIGHAKAAMLNQYFAREYKGKMIVRFDDTNPSKEKEEFEESIKEDLALLGIHADLQTYTSDHFEELYQFAIKMIKKGLAYVDDTDVNTMREQRMDGIDSKCRDLSIEKNLQRFDEMTKGTEFGLSCCLRAKIDMKNPNKALRDPVIYRCNLLPHHRTGNKWKLYPTYDFACPIVDSLEGVTHALRTNEYRDRNAQYEWMLQALDLKKVHIWDFSRMNFVYTLLSKRKLQWFVNEGLVEGWDDPRFPTVRGIRRRGMTVEALRQYILTQGASQNTVMLEWDKLWALNKSVIDPLAPRHTSILKQNLVKFKIQDGPENPHSKDLPKHKKNADVGMKKTWYSSTIFIDQDDAKTFEIDEEITLMDWGNVIVKALHKSDSNSELISTGELQLHLEGDFKKTKKKITWLADTPEVVEVMLVDYDYLINKRKLEENDEVEDHVTKKTEFLTGAIADSNVKDLKKGDIIQFERR
ncbi:11880_t:CDS:10, partial [Acaulospora morrowiae]